jgi:cytochrome P450
VREHLVLIVGAGCAPTAELLANALRLLLTDASLRRAVRGQELPISDAVHTVLWRLGPMEIYPWIYPTRDVHVAGQVIAEGTPVGLALAAANLAAAEAAGKTVPSANRAHLAYGVGPHACPDAARRLAHQIVADAIGALVERIDGLRLAVPPERLHRRPSIFAQALTALPVAYTRTRPVPPAHANSPVPHERQQDGGTCPAHQPNGSSWTPPWGPAHSPSNSTTSGRSLRWKFWARRHGR